MPQVCIFERMGNNRNFQHGCLDGGHRQADPIDADGTLLDDVSQCRFRKLYREVPAVPNSVEAPTSSAAIHRALNDVSTEPAVSPHRTLEVDEDSSVKILQAC